MPTAVRQASDQTRVATADAFFFQMAVVCAAVTVVGFVPTYWTPLITGRLAAHPILHVHALVFYAWSLLLVVQTWLAANRRLVRHRELGLLAISVATAMTILGISTAINRMHAAAAIGQKEAGLAFAIVPIGAILFFAATFTAAIVNVRRADWHKRLMLIAAVSVLDAPIARVFLTLLAPPGAVGPPPVSVDLGPSLVALLLLVAAMVVDWRRYGRIHAAYWIGAGAYLALKLVQGPLSGTRAWLATAEATMALGG
jgi:hypothetical protein